MLGPIGTEFTATMASDHEFQIGEIIHCDGKGTLQVFGYDGRTAMGHALWYKFRVVGTGI